ncbi:MAG: DUF4293 domain-containing protein [Bacteroidetes bacterium]|nr:DUF4293 domain-containing protein [Bacteroidota bacterium]
MIQRIQTIFLAVVFAVACLMLFLPFQSVDINGTTYPLCLLPGCSKEVMSPTVYVPMILNFIVMLLALVTIFQYKNRRFQIKLSNVLGILNVVLVGILFALHYVADYTLAPVSYKVASFLPLLSFAMAFMAAYYIKKDEALVRSADRIR